MKQIAVVCNNRREWDYFVETFQSNLSGREWNDYISMCFMSSEQVEYVKSKIKGEKL